MASHDRKDRRPTVAPPMKAADDEAATHPLLDLQQQAGNAAVAQLVALQRHTLDPEQEAGS